MGKAKIKLAKDYHLKLKLWLIPLMIHNYNIKIFERWIFGESTQTVDEHFCVFHQSIVIVKLICVNVVIGCGA